MFTVINLKRKWSETNGYVSVHTCMDGNIQILQKIRNVNRGHIIVMLDAGRYVGWITTFVDPLPLLISPLPFSQMLTRLPFS